MDFGCKLNCAGFAGRRFSFVTQSWCQGPKLRRHWARFLRGDVPDRLEKSAAVAAVYPFKGRVVHGLEAAPWPATEDDSGLEEPIDRLGERFLYLFPTPSTEGSMLASPSRSLSRMDKYCEQRLWVEPFQPGGHSALVPVIALLLARFTREIAILGRDHSPVTVRGHPVVQRRTPDQPDAVSARWSE